MNIQKSQFLVGIIVVVCLVLVFIAYAMFDAKDAEPQTEEMYACTAEALMCPDGSGVGRSGAQCTFSACPQVPYLSGELEQIGGDFQLILDADAMQGRGYVVPLQIEISNALGTLVGKRVTAFGRFESGNTFVVETLEEYQEREEEVIEQTEESVVTGEVGFKETMMINGVSVTFIEVEEDSRCPSDVTCITAGTFTATLELSEGETEEVLSISTGESITFGTHTISIESVLPIPDSRVQIESSNYVLTLRVE